MSPSPRVTFFLSIFFIQFVHALFGNWQNELKLKVAKGQFPSWMVEQIQEDLEPFKTTGINETDIWKTINDYPNYGFILCRIQENQFSWLCHPSSTYQDFRTQMCTNAIQELCNTIRLPNVVFLIFIGESFCEQGNAPVFSWCKHQEWSPVTVNIPDYEALCGNYNFLKEVSVGIKRYPWNSKLNSAFWRGGTTGGWGFDFMPRLKLAHVSAENPELLNAKFTGLFESQYNDPEQRELLLPYCSNPVSVSEHLRYKYQILMDGHVSAFSRYYWQLFANSLIFKHSSPWYQWFYRALKPYEHYIPFEADGSDLIQKLKWAVEHDDLAHKIVQNANAFANGNLKHSDVMLYVYLLFNEYAKMQN